MSCEKASRRLRTLIFKAKRLGLAVEEVAELPASRKLAPTRTGRRSWSILVAVLVVVGAGTILVILCAPCLARKAAKDVRVLP